MDILRMSENTSITQAFKLKGRLYTLTVLQVLHVHPQEFSLYLKETINRAPKMFENTPIVFDLSLVKKQNFDLSSLITICKENGLIPVAVQGGESFHNSLAQLNGLALINGSSSQDKPIIDTVVEPSEPVATKTTRTKLLTSPVRSGQQFVAKDSDLIVASSVSHGAELLADGCIHVYGTLRGRALAGISGDKTARIFCQSLDAELISIAGFYRVSDTLEPCAKPCQIYLKGEQIQIETI